MTVVHYLNQFFGGFGGEEAADTEPFKIDGPVGPGNALAGAGLAPNVTIGCGDDYFGQHEAEALGVLLGWITELAPDVLVCGPSFGSAGTDTPAACWRERSAVGASRSWAP